MVNYEFIDFNRGFENWKLVRLATLQDGSCLFHAIVSAYSINYLKCSLQGNPITHEQIVLKLRKELAVKLPLHYNNLNNGATNEFSKSVPEFTLDNMQKTLDSKEYIGYGYIEYIGNLLNKDIYILEDIGADLYKFDNPKLIIKGNRPSIVLYYISEHYETVGILNENGSIDTHFSPNHSFIKFLRSGI